MKQPNFLFIGPDKSGSSWIYEILMSHYQCFVPKCKDIYFFNRYYGNGLDWYLSFFKDAPKSALAVGELSHDYLFSVDAAERIYKYFPNIKIITSLRNPFERSFSQYLYMLRSGITNKSFDDAISAYPEITDNSLYYKHLSVYFDRFPRSQIKVMFFDKLVNNPVEYARELFEFLGVDFINDLPFNRRVRPASRARSYIVAKLVKYFAVAARDLGMANFVGTVKHSFISNILYKPYKDEEKPRLSRSNKQRLSSIFMHDIQKLEKLLKCDLQHWIELKN